MNFLEAFRRPQQAHALLDRILQSGASRTFRFMEVCGGHTMAIWRYGLPNLLAPSINLLSGPGCPVCVTPNGFLDRAMALSRQPDTIIVTFGDLMRVPGTSSTLLLEKARGADIRPVYSSRDALNMAHSNPERTVIFLGIGFETTAPTIAATMQAARQMGLKNLRLLSALKTMPQALRAIASGGEVKLDGLILPGHVSTITGTPIYEFLARDFSLPCVVSGFEPLDILQSLLMLVQQVQEGRADIEIQYGRSVRAEGNAKAREVMAAVFEPCAAEWRGLGLIPESGLRLNSKYQQMDASSLEVEVEPAREHPGCRCGAVIRGAIRPDECALFGASCTPENPVGACMVSEEGTCAAHYKYKSLDPLA